MAAPLGNVSHADGAFCDQRLAIRPGPARAPGVAYPPNAFLGRFRVALSLAAHDAGLLRGTHVLHASHPAPRAASSRSAGADGILSRVGHARGPAAVVAHPASGLQPEPRGPRPDCDDHQPDLRARPVCVPGGDLADPVRAVLFDARLAALSPDELVCRDHGFPLLEPDPGSPAVPARCDDARRSRYFADPHHGPADGRRCDHRIH